MGIFKAKFLTKQKDREHREMQKNKFARMKIAELMVDIREERISFYS